MSGGSVCRKIHGAHQDLFYRLHLGKESCSFAQVMSSEGAFMNLPDIPSTTNNSAGSSRAYQYSLHTWVTKYNILQYNTFLAHAI